MLSNVVVCVVLLKYGVHQGSVTGPMLIYCCLMNRLLILPTVFKIDPVISFGLIPGHARSVKIRHKCCYNSTC